MINGYAPNRREKSGVDELNLHLVALDPDDAPELDRAPPECDFMEGSGLERAAPRIAWRPVGSGPRDS